MIDVSLEKLCVCPTVSIKEVIQILNDGHQRIVLIVDDEYKLMGVVADSDIRRALLKGISFDLPVREIMVTKPIVASIEMRDREIFSLMRTKNCYEIPLLDKDNRVVGLRTLDTFIRKKQPTEVIVMSGGLGTRLQPLTETTPKPLIPVGGKPILFILLDYLVETGFCKITLILNYKASLIKEAIANIPNYSHLVHFIEERKRMGTVGALSLLETPPTTSFLVLNADLLTKIDFKAMLQFHKVDNNQITMAIKEEKYQIPFGVVNLRGTQVLEIEEKPSYRYFMNAGIYVMEPTVLKLIPENSFYDMPDLINDAIATGYRVGSFPLHEYWLDIGRPEELEQAQKDIVSEFFKNFL